MTLWLRFIPPMFSCCSLNFQNDSLEVLKDAVIKDAGEMSSEAMDFCREVWLIQQVPVQRGPTSYK